MKKFLNLVVAIFALAYCFQCVSPANASDTAPAYAGQRDVVLEPAQLNYSPSALLTLAPAYAGPVTVYESYDTMSSIPTLTNSVCNGPDCLGAPEYTYVNADGQTVTAKATASNGGYTSGVAASGSRPLVSWLQARPKPFRNFISKIFHRSKLGSCSGGCGCSR